MISALSKMGKKGNLFGNMASKGLTVNAKRDYMVYLWNTKIGEKMQDLKTGHTALATSDGQIVSSACTNGSIRGNENSYETQVRPGMGMVKQPDFKMRNLTHEETFKKFGEPDDVIDYGDEFVSDEQLVKAKDQVYDKNKIYRLLTGTRPDGKTVPQQNCNQTTWDILHNAAPDIYQKGYVSESTDEHTNEVVPYLSEEAKQGHDAQCQSIPLLIDEAHRKSKK